MPTHATRRAKRAGRAHPGIGRRRSIGLAAVALAGLLLMACGTRGDGDAGAVSPPRAAPTSAPTATTPAHTSVAASTAAPVAAAAETPGAAYVESGATSLGPGVHDFTLPTALGGEITLSSYVGRKNVVLVFYRGFW